MSREFVLIVIITTIFVSLYYIFILYLVYKSFPSIIKDTEGIYNEFRKKRPQTYQRYQ